MFVEKVRCFFLCYGIIVESVLGVIYFVFDSFGMGNKMVGVLFEFVMFLLCVDFGWCVWVVG